MSDPLVELGLQLRPLQDRQRELHLSSLGHGRMTRREAERLVLAAEAWEDRRSRIRTRRASVASAVLAAAAMMVFLLWPGRSELAFNVAGQPGDVGYWFTADTAELPLSFSDGSSFRIGSNSEAQVAKVGEHGAEFILRTGTLHADVVPADDNHWVIAAGPYQVHVLGTAFSVTWKGARERAIGKVQESGTGEFDVVVHRGKVRVTGPDLGDGRKVAAGERISVSRGHMVRAALGADPPNKTAATESELVARTTQPSEPPTPSNAPVAGSMAETPDWTELAKDGRHREAWAQAKKRGIGSLLVELSAPQALELADTARLAGDASGATSLLHAMRSRFSGTPTAALAAYTLGTTAFDKRGDYQTAARWFKIYLAEQPGGPLTGEAMGRLLEAQHRLGQTDQAKATAERYLKAFPGGVHRDIARRISKE